MYFEENKLHCTSAVRPLNLYLVYSNDSTRTYHVTQLHLINSLAVPGYASNVFRLPSSICRSHRDCRVYTDRQRGKQSSKKRDLELKMKNIAALRQPPYVIDRVTVAVLPVMLKQQVTSIYESV